MSEKKKTRRPGKRFLKRKGVGLLKINVTGSLKEDGKKSKEKD